MKSLNNRRRKENGRLIYQEIEAAFPPLRPRLRAMEMLT